MASLPGAIRSAVSDPWWGIKLLFTSAVLFSIYYFIKDFNTQLILYIISGIVILGCSISAMSRNVNNKFPIFPGLLNVKEIAICIFHGLIITLVFGAIAAGFVYGLIYLYDYILQTVNVEINEQLKIAFIALFSFIMFPLVIIPLILYSSENKLKDAFKFKLVSMAYGNVIMNLIIYIIQCAIILGISYICLFFFFYQMFGSMNHISIQGLSVLYIVAAYFLTVVYFSDMYDDVIPRIDDV